MKSACKMWTQRQLPEAIKPFAPVPPELLTLVTDFMDLQDSRHEADYDFTSSFSRTDAAGCRCSGGTRGQGRQAIRALPITRVSSPRWFLATSGIVSNPKSPGIDSSWTISPTATASSIAKTSPCRRSPRIRHAALRLQQEHAAAPSEAAPGAPSPPSIRLICYSIKTNGNLHICSAHGRRAGPAATSPAAANSIAL